MRVKEKNRVLLKEYAEEHLSCEVCGKRAHHIHHIKYKSQGGKDTEDNIISLCLSCHQRAHFLRKPYIKKEALFAIKRNNH